jgi:hypothetical protein
MAGLALDALRRGRNTPPHGAPRDLFEEIRGKYNRVPSVVAPRSQITPASPSDYTLFGKGPNPFSPVAAQQSDEDSDTDVEHSGDTPASTPPAVSAEGPRVEQPAAGDDVPVPQPSVAGSGEGLI